MGSFIRYTRHFRIVGGAAFSSAGPLHRRADFKQISSSSVMNVSCSVAAPDLASGFRPPPVLPWTLKARENRSPTEMTDYEKGARGASDPKSDAKRQAALQGALAQIERQFGKGAVMRMGDPGARVAVDAIPTGALSLDLALGIGGGPRGGVIEIFGPESSGKQALEIVDMLIRSGAVDVVAVDSVAALTPRVELEGQMGDQTVGAQARMM